MSLRKSIGSERDPARLGLQVHGRTKKRHGVQTITDSLDGVINTADVEMLKQCTNQIELIEKQQATCLTHLKELANKYFAKEISLLCIIPSIQKCSANVIPSEIGKDMTALVKASNLVGWTGLRPCKFN